MLRLGSRGLLRPRPLRGSSAAFSAGPRKKTVEEAKEDREPEYPFMLVNPRARMGDAAPIFMVAALYLVYCVAADVSDTIFPPPPSPPEADEAAEELQVLPDGRVLMKDGSIGPMPRRS